MLRKPNIFEGSAKMWLMSDYYQVPLKGGQEWFIKDEPTATVRGSGCE